VRKKIMLVLKAKHIISLHETSLRTEGGEMPLSLHLISEGILLITIIIAAPNPTSTTG